MKANGKLAPVWRAIIAVALVALPAAMRLPAADKLKPEQLVELHLKSIGAPEALAAVNSRMYRGQGIFRAVIGGQGQVAGAVFEASDRKLLSFRFDTGNNASYYGEHLIFDGDEAKIFQGFQNGRSTLGEFFKANDIVLKEGLLGGVTSVAWPLLAMSERAPRLKYAGLKKENGVELHRLDYRPKKGGGSLKIEIFFEPETYRHVRTEYSYNIPGGVGGGGPDSSADVQPTYITVTETFGNFQPVDGLTIPANWKILYNRTNQGTGPGSIVHEWEIAFSTVVNNEAIEPSYYQPGAKAQK